MERLGFEDKQHLLKIAAIVVMVLILMVFISLPLDSYLENRIQAILFDDFVTLSEETGYFIEYEQIEIDLFSAVSLKGLKILHIDRDTPIVTVEELVITYTLRDLLKGPSRKDMYYSLSGMELTLETDDIENIQTALQKLFTQFTPQDDFFTHISGTNISAELNDPNNFELNVELPDILLLLGNKNISGSLIEPVQITFFSNEFSDTMMNSLMAFSYDIAENRGEADITEAMLTYGDMFFEEISIAGELTPEHGGADVSMPGLLSHVTYKLAEKELSTKLLLDEFEIGDIIKVIKVSLPEQLSSADLPDISAEIDVSYDLDSKDLTYDGELSVENFKVGDSIELGATQLSVSGSEKSVIVQEFHTSILDYIIEFKGSFDDYLFFEPTGLLKVSEKESSSTLATIDFQEYNDQLFIDMSSDLLEGGSIKSSAVIDENNIKLVGEFSYENHSYDFDSNLDIGNRVFLTDIENGTALIQVDLTDSPIVFTGSIHNYPLGEIASLEKAQISGSYIDFQQWMVELEDIRIRDVIYNDNEVMLDLSTVITPDSINLRDIVLTENEQPLFGSGSVTYAFDDILKQPMIINMELSNDVERFLVEARYEDQWLSSTIDIVESRLTRLPIPIGSGYAKGYVSINGNLDDFLISGTMEIENGRRLHSSYSGDVKFDVTPDRFKIDSFTGNVGDVMVTDLDFIYDFDEQFIDAIAAIALTMDRRDFQANLILGTSLGEYDPSLSNFRSILRDEQLFFDIAMIDMVLDDEVISDQFVKATYDNKTLHLYDEENLGFDVKYHTDDGSFFAEVRDKYPISFTLEGILKDGEIDAVSNDVELEFSLYQQLGLPFLTFNDGSATGRFNVIGSLGDLEYYGEFFGRSLSASIPYTPEELLIDDIYISLIGKEIIFAPFYIRTKDTVNEATFSLFIDDIIPTGMDLNLMIADEQAVPIDYEFNQFKVKYIGRGSGDISLSGDFKELSIVGDATVSEGMVSILLNAVKKESRNPIAFVDLVVNTGKNLNAVFPNPELPILTAVAKEGEQLKVLVRHAQNKFTANGDIGIRGGEIIYFQKNFYIAEGVMNLNFTQDTIDPRVSVIAKLKDFDSNGEKVDIILSVEDDSVFDLSPSFSSSPYKTLTEISQILGNNIIPDDISSNSDISTALAVATLATDVIQQVGIIDIDPIDDLELSIRNALNLDLFSIRTQVLQNILLDTIPGDFSSTITKNPIARYLDNTTIFLGKYISDDMFLQAIMQLTVDDDYNTGLFITDDIGLDFEVSYEWNNPLNTLTISMAPDSLALKDVLDSVSIGMSWKLAL